MSKRTIKMPYKGRTVEAEEMIVQRATEEWNTYLLDDGTVIRLKPVVLRVARIPGEYDDEGNEIFIVKSNNVMVVDSPEDRRRQ
jgi:hypothetical protein